MISFSAIGLCPTLLAGRKLVFCGPRAMPWVDKFCPFRAKDADGTAAVQGENMPTQAWAWHPLLRQFFPKGGIFYMMGPSEVDRASKLLNNRPRKCLNYRTTTVVF